MALETWVPGAWASQSASLTSTLCTNERFVLIIICIIVLVLVLVMVLVLVFAGACVWEGAGSGADVSRFCKRQATSMYTNVRNSDNVAHHNTHPHHTYITHITHIKSRHTHHTCTLFNCRCGGFNPRRTIPAIIDAGCSDPVFNTARLQIREDVAYTGTKKDRAVEQSAAGTRINSGYECDNSRILLELTSMTHPLRFFSVTQRIQLGCTHLLPQRRRC